jgi:hypothetical protein
MTMKNLLKKPTSAAADAVTPDEYVDELDRLTSIAEIDDYFKKTREQYRDLGSRKMSAAALRQTAAALRAVADALVEAPPKRR